MITNGLDCDLVVENLYQGAAPPYGGLVAGAGFDVLVLCAHENQRADLYPRVEVVLAPGEDDSRIHRVERFLPIWKEAAAKVAEHVRAGRKVLVTCIAGLNRSGMVTAMALHELTGKSGADCVELIRASRDSALCNVTFALWLRDSLPAREPA